MSDAPPRRRKPAWLKVKAPAPRQYRATGALLDELELHTVCREARCPNKGECYSSGTATFLILGDPCTRGCRFCAVETGGAAGLCAVDADEPRRVAEAARRLALRHVVITSVTRDDLPDGGAAQFAAAVAAVRNRVPGATVEVLLPDLGGDQAALAAVLAARPDVIGHNLETVPRLYAGVRPQAAYGRSLELLGRAAAWARGVAPARPPAPAPARPAPPTLARSLVKSGLMVGLGETADEVSAVLADCAAAAVDVVTIGQYLQPERGCLPVARYVAPEEFHEYERRGAGLGLKVMAAPFVRSSYRAAELMERPAGERPAGGGARS
jgi:lipoic acid synthetase